MYVHIVGKATAREQWKSLEKVFASTSGARVMEVKLQLQTTRKRNMTIDQLFRIGHSVQENDLIMLILGSLEPDFNVCVCFLNNRADDFSIEETKSQLLSFENLLAHQSKIEDHQLMQANLVNSHASGSSSSESQGMSYNFFPNSSTNNNGGNQGRERGRGNENGNGRGNGRGRGTQCKFCQKIRHVASNCYVLKNLIGNSAPKGFGKNQASAYITITSENEGNSGGDSVLDSKQWCKPSRYQ